jgi:hypothetical protein
VKSISEQIRDLANEMANEGLHDLAMDAVKIAQSVEAAIIAMEQPDYGDTRSALDFYYEGKMILKGESL